MKYFKKSVIILLCLSISCVFFGCTAKSDLDKIGKDKTEYIMNLTYNNTEHTVSAEQTVRYVNNTGKVLTNVCFHLYPNFFSSGAVNKPVSSLDASKAYPNGFSEGYIQIKKLLVNNKNANYEITGEDDNILDVKFNIALQPTALHEIYIKYVVEIPNILHRFGYGENVTNLANFYPIACVFEDGKFNTNPYHSNGDPFYSDIANYNVTITYPKDFIIASTGNKSIKQENNKNVCKISAVAVRDFAFVLSNKFKVVTQEVDGVKVSYYYHSDIQPENSLLTGVKSLQTFNDLFGKYPYKTLDIVETGFVYGGMEYPNLVYISDSLETYEDYTYVIVHEIAHQWWYAVVGNDEYKYGWLDEGLTEYSCMLFYENNPEYNTDYTKLVSNALENYQLFLDVYSQVFDKVETTMNRNLSQFATQPEYIYTAYTKGMLLHDALRNILGTKSYLKCLKKYFQTYQFQNVTPQDMINCFSESCGKDLNGFFSAWLNGEVVFSSN